MAGRLNTGTGSRDPDAENGDPFVLRSEDERFTSLFRGRDGGVWVSNIGVVDPACENATDPFECEIAAEAGRDTGELESRERLLDSRRSQDWG